MGRLFRSPYISDARPSSTIQSKYDVIPPVTSYAASALRTPLISQNNIPPSTNRSGAPVVNRKDRRNGQQFFYSHGAVPMLPPIDQVAKGGVNTSRFQTSNVQLMDWQKNLSWFEAGFPRNLGWVTRVSILDTKASGGPGNSTMDSRPLFHRVQRVPRYQALPATYNTRSSNG